VQPQVDPGALAGLSSKRSPPRSHSGCNNQTRSLKVAALGSSRRRLVWVVTFTSISKGTCHGAAPSSWLQSRSLEDAPLHSNAVCPASSWSGVSSAQSRIHCCREISSAMANCRFSGGSWFPRRWLSLGTCGSSSARAVRQADRFDGLLRSDPGAPSQLAYRPLLSI
jgi:hypothetical protein